MSKIEAGGISPLVSKVNSSQDVFLGRGWLSDQNEKARPEESRKKEGQYFSLLWENYRNFFAPYQYLFPAQTFEATSDYYQKGGQAPPKFDLVRRLIYLGAQNVKDPFFDLYPLPGGTFLVSEKIAKQFEELWQNSPRTYFSGKVSEDSPPHRGLIKVVDYQRFLAERKGLLTCYRQQDSRLDILAQVNPGVIYYLEAFYFQRKTLSQIAREQKINLERAFFYKELGLRALGIKPKLKKDAYEAYYENRVRPILERWEEIKKRIGSLPLNLQQAAWLLLKGKIPKAVSQEFGLNFKATQILRQELLGKVPPYEAFQEERRRQAIETRFGLRFDQQPNTQLTLAVLEAKVRGESHQMISKNFGLGFSQIKSLLGETVKDLIEAFPSRIPQIPTIKRLRFKPEIWQQLFLSYKELTAKMTRQKRCLTPHQEKFLRWAQNSVRLSEAQRRLLCLYFKPTNPKRARWEERRRLAQAILERGVLSFSPEEQEIIRRIAEGERLHEIFPRGARDPRFRRILEQMERLASREGGN